MKILKWFYPGIGIKRWLFLVLLGLMLIWSGIIILIGDKMIFLINRYIGTYFVINSVVARVILAVIIIVLGVILIGESIKGAIRTFTRDNREGDELIDKLYRTKMLEKGPRIVALGGGTGLSTLLRGLKEYTSNITAIVTVADDGGSSGRLRDELGMLPPGDIRNCLVALADTEPLMERLFQYRFRADGTLDGHSFGNLFIASMTEVLGDFEQAVKESSKVLAIKGQVLPATNEDVRLGAVYSDNTVRMGESSIPREHKKIKRVFLQPGACRPTDDALNAIRQADIIIIGPGSLYTSIMPNLLIKGIAEEIKNSTALKMYISNVMTQPGETTGYRTSDHIQAIIDHVGNGLFDYVVVNTGDIPKNLAQKYKMEGSYPVKVDRKKVLSQGVNIIKGDLLSRDGYIRHDPSKLAETILKVYRGR
ncbi:gluconeogenesis factor YvcK family protein [Halothermothrix orenii]|uniref:Putative gluconeogenesis factor n=1 Tax=Halothermothrix orenii (strain H 168 / OCM 544 / DSM 9562) TaxID=373903 RepID=B8CYG7_HALOH|nr:gluconeogenesis factor YvcK family protein [Halothermothrix orenii]ACL70336.1 conserved hypothetical protein, cofD-related TIGR01826 [Halothermothrix orenii H 168]